MPTVSDMSISYSKYTNCESADFRPLYAVIDSFALGRRQEALRRAGRMVRSQEQLDAQKPERACIVTWLLPSCRLPSFRS